MEAQGCVFQHPTSKRQVTQAPNSVQIHPQLVNGLLVPSLLCAPCSFGCACVGGGTKMGTGLSYPGLPIGPTDYSASFDRNFRTRSNNHLRSRASLSCLIRDYSRSGTSLPPPIPPLRSSLRFLYQKKTKTISNKTCTSFCSTLLY